MLTFNRHVEYRMPLIRHVVDVSLAHYDAELRALGAEALGAIVLLDPPGLIPLLVDAQVCCSLYECS